MTIDDIYNWAKNHLTFNYNLYHETIPIVISINKEITSLHMRTLVSRGFSSKAYRLIEETRNKYLKIMDDLFDIAEDAWYRVKDYAKQEMFDDDEEKWDDWDEIGDEEMDHHFDESYFIDYFTQEVGHNVTGKYPEWDKYLSKLDFRKWNNDYQGLEDYIAEEYLEPMKDEINDTCDTLKNAVNSMVKEYNLNKHNMIKMAMGIDEYDLDWEDI